MPSDVITLYTVGHSNRSIDEFLSLLRHAGITCLVDVRAYPGSRRHPHFKDDELRLSLAEAGVDYVWAGRDLGGHRKPRSDSRHAALEQSAFQAYADHMETGAFEDAVRRLVERARSHPTAVMCAEKRPEHCHRSFIADYLTVRDHRVLHLVDASQAKEHAINPYARMVSGRLVYDRLQTGQLDLGG